MYFVEHQSSSVIVLMVSAGWDLAQLVGHSPKVLVLQDRITLLDPFTDVYSCPNYWHTSGIWKAVAHAKGNRLMKKKWDSSTFMSKKNCWTTEVSSLIYQCAHEVSLNKTKAAWRGLHVIVYAPRGGHYTNRSLVKSYYSLLRISTLSQFKHVAAEPGPLVPCLAGFNPHQCVTGLFILREQDVTQW